MRLSFYGACREVTGSNFLLEASGHKMLLDCGFFQGFSHAEERNYDKFQFNPKSIDFVVVGHAHLDHVGRLPKLVREGFSGRIYATAPTKELAALVLEDNFKLMSEEADRDNHKPLYDERDIENLLQLFEALPYNETLEIAPDICLTFRNAGHILGSAITVLDVEGKKLVYTSDLGNNPSTLLEPPADVDAADYVICESTYGGRIHEDESTRLNKLSEIISTTVNNNGVLMIPTFAIERTQELLGDVDKFCTVNNCETPTFFLDSPLAIKVTAVFSKYPEFLSKKLVSENVDGDFFGLERVKITSTVEESKSINDAACPKIIIAGSGMMNGGRILHHMRRYLTDGNNTLLIVGYQATGTLGRKLIEGAGEIHIFGKRIEVRANIKKIGSYSAHADMPQLVNWLSKIKGLKKVFLVHGEADQSLKLAEGIKDKIGVDGYLPQIGESYQL